MLSEQESERYLRQTQLPSFGDEGQKRLKNAKVLIVGLGGLGCPVAQYLTAAGVGEIVLVDGDAVSLSNLHRQILFTETDIGKNKADAAAAKLRANNSDISIKSLKSSLTLDNAHPLIKHCDLVLDCTDNFYSRYLINDICAHHNTPWIYASVLGYEGQLALIEPRHSCFRCLYPELAETPNCNQAGVIGAVPGIIGSMQALLAIDYIAQTRAPFLERERNQLHIVQGVLGRSISLHKSPDCALCTGQKSYRDFSEDYCPSKEDKLDEQYRISWQDFQALDPEHAVLIDVRTSEEHQRFNIGGSNIPLEELKESLQLLDKNHYVFYCQSGQRSEQAIRLYENEIPTLKDSDTYLLSLSGGLNKRH